MALSWTEAQQQIMAPGSGTPFELVEGEIRGVKMDVFKNSPPNLALVLQNARNFGDTTFLVYEGEKWSFARTMDQVVGLCHLMVNTYGIKKGDRVAIAMRNFLRKKRRQWGTPVPCLIECSGCSIQGVILSQGPHYCGHDSVTCFQTPRSGAEVLTDAKTRG